MSTSPPMLGETIGNYEVLGHLGAGGMGVVYRARDVKLKRSVALKFLPPQTARDPLARARFLREAQAASTLDHPNIGTVFEIGEHQGAMFIAMALYEGETLKARLERGRLAPEECDSLLRQLLAGVGAAHSVGIVHRDLKPANVMVTPTGQVKVLDFGLAKLTASEEEGSTDLTATGTTLGTIAYMSPEQARGEEVDARSDLWSIGVIAYEMLAGTHPFAAPGRVGVLTRIASEEPRPLAEIRPEVPESWRRAIEALLRKRREERPASAEGVLAQLTGGPSGRIAQPGSPARYRAWHAAIALIVLVLVGTLGLDLSRRPAAAAGGFVLLPCQVFGPEESRYLTDAVPSTVAAFLAEVKGLEVRKPPTSIEIDPQKVDLRKVASLYQANRCVTCSVTVAAAHLLIAVQLVEPGSRRLLWSGTYEGTPATYIDLVRRSADALRAELLPGSRPAAAPSGAPASSAAELEFRRGEYHLNRFNNRREMHDFEAAKAAFERALELDPGLAQAAGDIAFLLLWRPQPDPEEAERWARKALAIDEHCGRAWTALAFREYSRPQIDLGETLRLGLRAVADSPLDELAPYSVLNIVQYIDADLALASARQSIRIDPLYAWGHLGEAVQSSYSGRAEGGLRSLDRALDVEPEMDGARLYKCLFLVLLDRDREANALLDAIRREAEPPTPEYVYVLVQRIVAWSHAGAGSKPQALADLRVFLERECTSADCLDYAVNPGLPILLRRGEVDLSVWLVDRWYAAGGGLPYRELLHGTDFEPLRRDPRFAEIASRARDRFLVVRGVLEAARTRGELPEFLEAPLAALERAPV